MKPLDEVSPPSDFLGRVRSTEVWSTVRSGSVGKTWRSLRQSAREFSSWAGRERSVHADVALLIESLAELQAQPYDSHTSTTDQEDAPIFLLATGWKTGSTLLQRILVTDPQLLLWGEPLGEMAFVSKLAVILTHFSSYRGLHEWTIQGQPNSSELATSWIATLFPPGEDLRLGFRSFFDRWLKEPVRQRGFSRWGFKEVRLGAAEAVLLHWLYPKARFLLLTRHPYDCYRSLADASWWPLYSCNPDVRIDTAAKFARHWNRLVQSWSQLPPDFPCLRLKYEDLIEGRINLRQLEDWLGLKLDENLALETVLGHTAIRARLGWYERLIIGSEAAAGMKTLGYF